MSRKATHIVINTLRALALDQIAKAKSGHPGMALGAAPIMYTLFRNHLNVNPKSPEYFNRDRFILSAGHCSALLYATLVCGGFSGINIDDLKKFRQLNSKTAGHPEPDKIPGVEVSSGPLGQGIAMAVGMAIAEKKLAATYNEYSQIVDHYTYCLHGDGCLQEGVALEAIELAGKLRLNKLILLYDSNDIQLDGAVKDTSVTNVAKMFIANNWNYIKVRNGNNVDAINNAIREAKYSELPTIIEIKTTIGWGTNKANSNKCHGTPFTEEEVDQIKKDWKYRYSKWTIPQEVETDFANVISKRVGKVVVNYNKHLTNLERRNIKLYYSYVDTVKDNFGLNIKWYKSLKVKTNDATRNTMGTIVDVAAKHLNNLMVGSADVSSSTKIGTSNTSTVFEDHNYSGQVIRFGVREFAMTAIVNGICAHKGVRAIGSTFFAFSDYCKPALRLAAIGKIPSINIYSHDSITVGEDGPTHQPIEQLGSLRMVPNLYVFRPSNYQECLFALNFGLTKYTAPSVIVASRSNFEQRPVNNFDLIKKGAYFVKYSAANKYTLIGTGSEVATCFEVAKILEKEYKTPVNIVSGMCMELFEQQDNAYKNLILKKPVISIEFGATAYWYKYSKHPIGIDTFGKSAPEADLIRALDLEPRQIALNIVKYLGLKKKK